MHSYFKNSCKFLRKRNKEFRNNFKFRQREFSYQNYRKFQLFGMESVIPLFGAKFEIWIEHPSPTTPAYDARHARSSPSSRPTHRSPIQGIRHPRICAHRSVWSGENFLIFRNPKIFLENNNLFKILSKNFR